MVRKNPSLNFKKAFYEVLKINLLLPSVARTFHGKNLYFNWGLVWDTFNPLIVVVGLAALVSLGLRGRGFDLEYMLFIFLFWFAFSSFIAKIVQFKPRPFLISKRFISPWLIFFTEFASMIVSLFLRFLLCILAMNFFGFELQLFHLFTTFILINLFGFSYALLVATIFHNNSFVADSHSYFVQGLFFTSSIIIPVPLLPEDIRNVLLFNPLVHLFEWLKAPTIGIYYEFIDLNYFLVFLFLLLIHLPLVLYIKNKKILDN
tara:strand:- start:3911 stop:4693 length:783 start_codon:yes stop_codon:yes gene_type:complete